MPDKRIAHLQDLYSLLRQLEMALGERGRLLIAPVVLDCHKGEFTFFRTVERIAQIRDRVLAWSASERMR